MRVIAAVLLFIFASNSFLYYAWFQVSVIQARSDMGEAISELKNADVEHLIKIPVSSLDKDESDEVWYQGNLYDVVKREHDTTNTQYVYVLSDEKEQNLLTGAGDYFRSAGDNIACGHSSIHGVKISHGQFSWQFTVPPIRTDCFKNSISQGGYALHTFSTHPGKPEVLVPPPKYFLQ